MEPTYAVVWREGRGPVCSGKLTLARDELRLDGAVSGTAVELSAPYADVRAVRIARSRDERLNGRTALLVDARDAPALTIASASGVGIVQELADRLHELIGTTGQLEPHDAGSRERATPVAEASRERQAQIV